MAFVKMGTQPTKLDSFDDNVHESIGVLREDMKGQKQIMCQSKNDRFWRGYVADVSIPKGAIVAKLDIPNMVGQATSYRTNIFKIDNIRTDKHGDYTVCQSYWDINRITYQKGVTYTNPVDTSLKNKQSFGLHFYKERIDETNMPQR